MQEPKKEYVKSKIEELETNSNIKNTRYLYKGISDCKKRYLRREYSKGNLLTGSHSILSSGGTISLNYWIYMGLSLWFSYEGGLLYYSHWDFYPHDPGKVNKMCLN